MPQIDVCIATYKRPQLLEKLLHSLNQQICADKFTINVIVIDNDAAGSAEAIVRKQTNFKHQIVYAKEHRQNISRARNKALTLSNGDFFATIDDDQYADSHWLLNLYRALLDHRADVVMGPVERLFPQNTPDYIRSNAIFNFPNPATGATSNFVRSTRNCLVRRSSLEESSTPFDPEFGLTGGGDAAFFEKLLQRGRKIIWCKSAVAYESISPERASFPGILRRFFRNGQVTFLTNNKNQMTDHLSKRKMTFKCFKMIATNSLKLFAAIIRHPFPSVIPAKTISYFSSISYATGFLLGWLNLRYSIYRSHS